MAYASSYDKFEDLEYTQMMKTKHTKMYAKKRRLKCCGIAIGATYNVNLNANTTTTMMTTTTTTTINTNMDNNSSSSNVVVDEYTTDMIKNKNNNADGNDDSTVCGKKRACCARSHMNRTTIAAWMLVLLLVVALVAVLVWVATAGYSNHPKDNEMAMPTRTRNLTMSGSLDLEFDNELNKSRKNKQRYEDIDDDEDDDGNSSGSPTVAVSSLPSETSPSDSIIFFNDALLQNTTPSLPTTTHFNRTSSSTNNNNVEYVIPLKRGPKPLHTQDIIYDEIRNITPAKPYPQQPREDEDGEENQLALPSGHFRDNNAELFDPHPEYVIKAFGQKFVLELSQNSYFSPHYIRVVHIERNNSRKVNITENPACYYTGIVRGEVHSYVGVSLCNGMTGYLKTSHGDFQIEPVEAYESTKHTKTSIRHKMTKIPFTEDHHLGHHDHDEIVTNPMVNVDLHFLDRQPLNRSKRSTYNNRLPDDRYEDDVVNVHNNYQQYHYQHYGNEEDYRQRNFINSHSTKPYFIATLVVADRKMYEYHKNNEDLTRYILTLMSHVALLFKDATIGNPITLVVVDIMILYDVEFTSPTSTDVLRKFCEYQNVHSHKQHDVALLFTRDVICKNASVDSSDCRTLGVAEVGSMCSPTSSCAIIRDKGLSTSYTIAHELGHVLSMPHDNDIKCQVINKGTTPNKIMAKSLHNDTQPWHWSQCSKHYLTEFLNSPGSRCLVDEPLKDHITGNPLSPHASLLPGQKFQVDRQCELEFGTGSRLCSFMPECSTLWCTHAYDTIESSGCTTQYMPWADGTPCDRNRKMCLQGKCTYRNNFQPVSGGWGTWKASGTCSRTCGGGIMMYIRECNSPTPAYGGPYCTGGSRYYESCNTQSCAQNTPDFREMQCAQFNGNNKGLQGLNDNVRWVPKYGTNPEDACKLYCRVDRSFSYYLLENKVLDGTKCGLNSFDICVNGVCMEAGCDNKLGSNVTLDDCGNCGGDNSQCHLVTGFYNNSVYGYNHVVLIPKGSSNIVIRQNGQEMGSIDENYLALKEAPISDYMYKKRRSGPEYLLNGNSVISGYSKDIIYGGLTFRYSGSKNTDESIITPRNAKLTKDVLVEVLQVGNLTLPNITYSYTIGKSEAPNYSWERYKDGWTACDSICRGYRYPFTKCKDMSLHIQVDDSYCAAIERGSPVVCHTHCELEWRVASRGQCSAYCGPGWRTLTYQCVKVNIIDQKLQIVDEKHCRGQPSPELRERCEGACESIHWEYQEWSQCTKACGGGYQERRAICVDNQDNILDDSYCSRHEKHAKQLCNNEKCPSWFYQEWSSCSVSCGTGIRRRQSSCRRGDQIVSRQYCDSHSMQPTEESCSLAECVLDAIWMKGDWNDCNGHCGATYQQRLVTCMDAYTLERFPDEHCRSIAKPNESRSCRLLSCEYEWRTGDWSKCSEKCGRGKQSRQVRCIPKDATDTLPLPPGSDPESYCDGHSRPVNVTSCEGVDCARKQLWNDWKYEWVVEKFQECSTSCGTGERNRSVICRVSINGTSHKVVDQRCNHLPFKPPSRKPCKRFHCAFVWMESNWSPCSSTCGRGIRKRNVTCYKVNRSHPNHNRLRQRNGKHSDLLYPVVYDENRPSDYCPQYAKTHSEEICNEMDCNDEYHWKKSAWRPCRQSCGMERQRRRVYCVNRRDKRVRDDFCLNLGRQKPRRRRKCNNLPCLNDYPKNCREVKTMNKSRGNDDYQLIVHNVVVKIYCYKMDTAYPEEYITLPPGSSNYAEFYGKKLRSHVTHCPTTRETTTGSENDSDYETMGGNAEKTEFWKVRIDIVAMKIIADDFTFSKNQNDTENRILYGTAGDCFSAIRGCVRGSFKIDLSGTSFRLSPNVSWIAYGQNPTRRIIQSNKHKLIGQCGGNCGGCIPNPKIGLKVEVT